jgi:predicted RNA-binding Zn ribbon-like protein
MKRRRTKKKDAWPDAVGNAPWARLVAPAPGDLRLVHALVNTVDEVHGRDELTSPRALGDWLVRWGLAPADTVITQVNFERALGVRDALRVLVAANGGGALDEATVATLDQAAGDALLRLRFGRGGNIRYELATAGFEGVLARLLHVVATAQRDREWRRLKLCANPDCRRAFYDASQNRFGKWCSLKRCGNLLNSRKFRSRHPEYWKSR